MTTVIGGAVLFGLGALIIWLLRQAGKDAAEAKQAEADLALAKKQAEIMAEQRTQEDAITRLDRGTF